MKQAEEERTPPPAEDDDAIICDWEDGGPGEEDEEGPPSFNLKSILERLEAVVAAHAARTDDAAAFTEAAKKDLLLLKKHRKLEFRRMVAKLRTTKCDVPGLLKALKAAGMKADTTSRANSKLSDYIYNEHLYPEPQNVPWILERGATGL